MHDRTEADMNGRLKGVVVALLIAGVIGSVANYAKVAAIESTVQQIEKRMDRADSARDKIDAKVEQILRDRSKEREK